MRQPWELLFGVGGFEHRRMDKERRIGMSEKELLDEIFELALQNDMNYLG